MVRGRTAFIVQKWSTIFNCGNITQLEISLHCTSIRSDSECALNRTPSWPGVPLTSCVSDTDVSLIFFRCDFVAVGRGFKLNPLVTCHCSWNNQTMNAAFLFPELICQSNVVTRDHKIFQMLKSLQVSLFSHVSCHCSVLYEQTGTMTHIICCVLSDLSPRCYRTIHTV